MNNKNLVLPSHIKNSFEYLQKIKKQIDLVIHLMDSRSIATSGAINVDKIFPHKKVLEIYTKSDLSDVSNTTHSFNLKKEGCGRKILKLIKETLVEHYKSKNIFHFPCSQVVIIGIPNVGKSTLINILKKKRSSKNENLPGTTKQITRYYIGENIWLYDTPGIMLPRLNNEENIKKLFLLNSLPVNHENNLLFLEKAYDYLKFHYPQKIECLTNELHENYSDFLNSMAQKYNLKTKNNKLDLHETEKKFLLLIHSGKIGKLKWDKSWSF